MKDPAIVPIGLAVLVTLIIIGGFTALDRTVLHWYVKETGVVQEKSAEGPSLTQDDVLGIAQAAMGRGTDWTWKCSQASYSAGYAKWVVSCVGTAGPTSLLPPPGTQEAATILIDDPTGEIAK